MTLHFDDVIICDYIRPKKGSQTSSLSLTNRPRRNTWIFLFNKLNVVFETLRPVQRQFVNVSECQVNCACK